MTETLREDPDLIRGSQRWKWVGTVMLLLLVVAFPVYKAVESSRRADAVRSQDVALISSGQQLWAINCAACHGTNGQGVDAPALNSQEFFEGTSDEQIAEVVTYVRSWEKTAPSCPDWRTPSCPGSGA
jgi:mono/diheme cytochrome c family protein